MRLVQRIPEQAMVAHFLWTELHSERFGAQIRRLLEREYVDAEILESPDLSDASENLQRAKLLAELRGYGRNRDVFTDLPIDVQWWRGFVGTSDLRRIKYLNDEYWTAFSGGSRLVMDAATRIITGTMPEDAAGYRALAKVIEQGARIPELIVLYNPKEKELVVLEGHVRVTAYGVYLMLSENATLELPVLVGCSDSMKK